MANRFIILDQGNVLPDLDDLFPHFGMLPDDEKIIPALGRLIIHTKYHLDRGELARVVIEPPNNSTYTFIKLFLATGPGLLIGGNTAAELASDWATNLIRLDELITQQKAQGKCPGGVFIRECAYTSCQVCRKEPAPTSPC